MLRVRVHNKVTDQRYVFTAADQAEIDARLVRKANVYGLGERRESAQSVFAFEHWQIEADETGVLWMVWPEHIHCSGTEDGLGIGIPKDDDPPELDGGMPPMHLEKESSEERVPERRQPLCDARPAWYAHGTPRLEGDVVVIAAEYEVEVVDTTAEDRAKRRAEFEAKLDAHVDALARSWGYRHQDSLAGYATSTNDKWRWEAQVFLQWRDYFWARVLEVQAQFDAGVITTEEEFMAQLLPYPERPA